MPATASAVTGELSEKGGRRWIKATRIEACTLKYPERMLAADQPFVMPSREPLLLKIGDKHTLKCIHIPAGKFLMGTPIYMWPYHLEEYPHQVTLTRDYYLAETPITQEMYEAVMGNNPSVVKDPKLPVQNPMFADLKKFCDAVSEKNGKTVRLPTSAEWEYAARVGTSNPGFAEKYREQNSSGTSGYKSPLTVKSKKPNAWGLYDMLGNVMEWTLDGYAPYKPGDAVNPWVKPTGPYPIAVRGGSWNDPAAQVTCTARVASDASWKQQDPQLPKSIWYMTDAQWLGFRLVRPVKIPTADEMYRYWNSGFEHDEQ
jgi:formylglycine-generating enzyme required for sulfatase activity